MMNSSYKEKGILIIDSGIEAKAKNKNAQKYVDQNPFGVPVILQTTLKSHG